MPRKTSTGLSGFGKERIIPWTIPYRVLTLGPGPVFPAGKGDPFSVDRMYIIVNKKIVSVKVELSIATDPIVLLSSQRRAPEGNDASLVALWCKTNRASSWKVCFQFHDRFQDISIGPWRLRSEDNLERAERWACRVEKEYWIKTMESLLLHGSKVSFFFFVHPLWGNKSAWYCAGHKETKRAWVWLKEANFLNGAKI